MKKLIPIQGKGRKAVVEISEKGAAVKPNTPGELWLYGGSLTRAGECTDFSRVAGAVLVQDGAAVMWGGIGTGERARRILAEAVMRSGGEAPRETPAPERPPVHKEEEKPLNAAGNNNVSSGVSRPPNPGAALLEILKKAEELFPSTPQQPERRDDPALLNPFPDAFPFSRWHRREYPGTNRYYLEGEWLKGGVTYMIYAIPGEQRGSRHRGFPRFLRSRDGSGYWVKVQKK